MNLQIKKSEWIQIIVKDKMPFKHLDFCNKFVFEVYHAFISLYSHQDSRK